MTAPLINRLHDGSDVNSVDNQPPDVMETRPNVMETRPNVMETRPNVMETRPNVVETRPPAPINQTRISSLSPPPLEPPNTEHLEQKGSEVTITPGHLELPNEVEGVFTLSGGIQRVTAASTLQVTEGYQRVNVPEGYQRVNVSEGSQRVNVSAVPEKLADATNGKIDTSGKATPTGGGVLVMEAVVESLQEASVVSTVTYRSPNTLILTTANHNNNNNNNNNNNGNHLPQDTEQERRHFVRLQPVAVGDDDADSVWLPTQKPLPSHPPHHSSIPLHTLQDHTHTDVEGVSPWYMTSPSSSSSSSPLATSPSRGSPLSHAGHNCTSTYDHLPHYPKGCTNKKKQIRSSSCLSWDENTPIHTQGNLRHMESSRSFDNVIDCMEEGNPHTPIGMDFHARHGMEWFKGTQPPGGLEPRGHTDDRQVPRRLPCKRLSPEPSRSPEPPRLPAPSRSPEPSRLPAPSRSPEPPRLPAPSRSPEPPRLPAPSRSPEPPRLPGPSRSPEPSRLPAPSRSPEPPRLPAPSRFPEPPRLPGPSRSPEPSRLLGLSRSPEPPRLPGPSRSPEPPGRRANGTLMFLPPRDPMGQSSGQATPPASMKRHSSWVKRHSEGSRPGMETDDDDLASFLSLELTRLNMWGRGKSDDGSSVCSQATSAVTHDGRAKASSISLDHSHGHTFEVWLSKEPSGVGFSITSGRDTAGSSRPGDKGYTYHVWKVGSAHCKGRIKTGDRLLQVNGNNVSSLCYAEVMHLLAGPEKVVSVVLYREPSVTLL
eukprot:Em0011g864a